MTDQTESRSTFLTKIGQAGGDAALHETMVARGLLNIPVLPPDHGLGKSALILGARDLQGPPRASLSQSNVEHTLAAAGLVRVCFRQVLKKFCYCLLA